MMSEPRFIESARHVLENGFAIVDLKTGERDAALSWDYSRDDELDEEEGLCVFDAAGEKVDGYTLLDAQTANMLVQIWDRLNETNREKFGGLSLLKAVDVGWGCVR